MSTTQRSQPNVLSKKTMSLSIDFGTPTMDKGLSTRSCPRKLGAILQCLALWVNKEQTMSKQVLFKLLFSSILKHNHAMATGLFSEALACPSSWQLGKASWQLPRLLITNPATNAARNAYRPNAVLSLLYRGQVTCVPSPPTVKSLSQSFCCKLEYRMTGSKSKDAQRCQLEQNVQPKKT